MLLWQRPDLIPQLLPKVDFAEVQRVREEANKQFEIEKFRKMLDPVMALPLADEIVSQSPDGMIQCDLSGDHVSIGSSDDVNDAQMEKIDAAIAAMRPWRKGPFRLFGCEIDSEWRSNLKWDRILPALGDLSKRRVLDLGCGNGYYMFRAAEHNPGFVLGLDPSNPFYLAFEMIQAYLQRPKLQYERMGFQHLKMFENEFDVALCMGIVYHHRSPVDILQDLRMSLHRGGFAIIESQTIPGEGTQALFPKDRYAKARNVYFVPTKDCLVNWARRAGFKNVEIISHTPVTLEEQRATPFMAMESLGDFLDPNDPTRTIEGYPAPYRTAIRAERIY